MYIHWYTPFSCTNHMASTLKCTQQDKILTHHKCKEYSVCHRGGTGNRCPREFRRKEPGLEQTGMASREVQTCPRIWTGERKEKGHPIC